MWKLNCGKIRMNTADVELLRKNTEWSKKERARNGWRKKKFSWWPQDFKIFKKMKEERDEKNNKNRAETRAKEGGWANVRDGGREVWVRWKTTEGGKHADGKWRKWGRSVKERLEMKKKETPMKAILIVIVRKTDEGKLRKTGGGESKAEKKFSPAGRGQTETANKK